jgi:hypothetical protein
MTSVSPSSIHIQMSRDSELWRITWRDRRGVKCYRSKVRNLAVRESTFLWFLLSSRTLTGLRTVMSDNRKLMKYCWGMNHARVCCCYRRRWNFFIYCLFVAQVKRERFFPWIVVTKTLSRAEKKTKMSKADPPPYGFIPPPSAPPSYAQGENAIFRSKNLLGTQKFSQLFSCEWSERGCTYDTPTTDPDRPANCHHCHPTRTTLHTHNLPIMWMRDEHENANLAWTHRLR